MCKHTAVNEVEAELKKNPGVVASVNTETGEVLTFMAPKPYWETKNDAGDTGSLTASEVTALEKERQDLIAALPQMKKADRSKSTTRISIIEGLLLRGRGGDESARRNVERQAERPVQRYGQPGNTSSTDSTAKPTAEMVANAKKVLKAAGWSGLG